MLLASDADASSHELWKSPMALASALRLSRQWAYGEAEAILAASSATPKSAMLVSKVPVVSLRGEAACFRLL